MSDVPRKRRDLNMTARHTCPCCGYRTFDDIPGSYSYGLCHVCFWEDDPVQLLDPWFAGGANRPNLHDAQATYATHGAMERRFLSNAKGVLTTDVRDPTWRRVQESDRTFVRAPRDLSDEEMKDLTVWYYWRRHAQKDS